MSGITHTGARDRMLALLAPTKQMIPAAIAPAATAPAVNLASGGTPALDSSPDRQVLSNGARLVVLEIGAGSHIRTIRNRAEAAVRDCLRASGEALLVPRINNLSKAHIIYNCSKN